MNSNKLQCRLIHVRGSGDQCRKQALSGQLFCSACLKMKKCQRILTEIKFTPDGKIDLNKSGFVTSRSRPNYVTSLTDLLNAVTFIVYDDEVKRTDY